MKRPDTDNLDVDIDMEDVKNRLTTAKQWLVEKAGDVRSASEDAELPVSKPKLALILSALLAVVVLAAVVAFAPFLWTVAVLAIIVGFIPGVLLFPWVTSPFGPRVADARRAVRPHPPDD